LIGWRFGLMLSSILIPEICDIATTVVALYILVSAVRYRSQSHFAAHGTEHRDLFYRCLVPFAGDLFRRLVETEYSKH